MEPLSVVNRLDKMADALSGFCQVLVFAEINFFILERLHKRFGLRVVIRVSATAHADLNARCLEQIRILVAGILNASVGVMHQTGLDFPMRQGHLQGRNHHTSIYAPLQCPPDDAARVSVKNNGQINELTLQANVGDVGPPQNIDVRHRKFLCQVRINRLVMVAVSGADELPFPQTQQILLPHEAKNALVVDRLALPVQFFGDTAVAIGRVLQRNSLNTRTQFDVFLRRRRLFPMPIESSAGETQRLAYLPHRERVFGLGLFGSEGA